MAIEKHGQMEF
jgi:hypothetical protein